MKRMVFDAPNQHRMETVDDPRITKTDDVIIDVKGIGLCGTDLHIYRGHRKVNYPHVSGHECVGFVREVGDSVTRVAPGDYVTVEPNFCCRSCYTCLSGHKNLCPSKVTMGLNIPGCFSDTIMLSEDNVWKLPRSISFEEGILIETATVALSGIKKAQISIGEKVLIMGSGCIGMLVMQLAKMSGAFVCMADKNQYRLDCSRELGADELYCVDSQQPPDEYFDVVIDAAGVPATVNSTTRFVKSGGRIILVGIPSSSIDMDVMSIVRRELKICGSVACVTEFPEVINLVASDLLKVKELVTHKIAMEEIVYGLELMEECKALKPLVLIE